MEFCVIFWNIVKRDFVNLKSGTGSVSFFAERNGKFPHAFAQSS